MSEKSIIIIGAGIAGLSAGCYGQMNGYRTQIFEMHTLPGGLCTSWKRKGYTVDGCIHWLNGSGKGSNLNQLWLEIGALQNKQIINHDEFVRVIGENGKAYILYTNIDRYIQHLKELAPEDHAYIDQFAADMHKFAGFDMPTGKPAEISNIFDNLKMIPAVLPYLGLLRKYMNMTIKEFAAGFKNPFLREVFTIPFELPNFPMFGFIFTLIDMHNQNAGYPIGGSLEFSRSIERRYLELGGKIQYQARVEKILVENNRAVGIRLQDGSEHHADIIISAADGHATIFDMLEGKYINDTIRGYYEKLPIFEPAIQVSLGINRDLSIEPHHISVRLEQPVEIAGEMQNHISFKHYAYDPTLAPAGKTLLTTMFISNYKYWKEIKEEDTEKYEAEKQDIALKVINRLETLYPGITRDIEMSDVATPLTFERYTGNWQGSYEGWLITTDTMKMMFGKGMKKTLPGLDNFYMIGQWVQPGGGLPTGLLTGRDIVQVICHKDKKKFKTEIPGSQTG